MQQIIKYIGKFFIGLSFIFLIVFSFVFISDGNSTTDLFGFVIHEPPMWISLVPIINSLLSFLYKLFSIHGLIDLLIFTTLLVIGVNLNSFENTKRPDLKKQIEQEVDNLSSKHFPKLIQWRESNRKGLVEQILRDKQRVPKDSIEMIMASYESDLEYL